MDEASPSPEHPCMSSWRIDPVYASVSSLSNKQSTLLASGLPARKSIQTLVSTKTIRIGSAASNPDLQPSGSCRAIPEFFSDLCAAQIPGVPYGRDLSLSAARKDEGPGLPIPNQARYSFSYTHNYHNLVYPASFCFIGRRPWPSGRGQP